MFPSSNRVKLNRVALKDVIGLKVVPRRRRVPEALNNVTGDSKQQQESQLVCEVVSVKGSASGPSSYEPVQTCPTDPMGPESVTGAAGDIPEGEPEEESVGTQKAKGNNVRSYKGKEFKHQGPCTRGKHQQSTPNTRSKSRTASESCATSDWGLPAAFAPPQTASVRCLSGRRSGARSATCLLKLS